MILGRQLDQTRRGAGRINTAEGTHGLSRIRPMRNRTAYLSRIVKMWVPSGKRIILGGLAAEGCDQIITEPAAIAAQLARHWRPQFAYKPIDHSVAFEVLRTATPFMSWDWAGYRVIDSNFYIRTLRYMHDTSPGHDGFLYSSYGALRIEARHCSKMFGTKSSPPTGCRIRSITSMSFALLRNLLPFTNTVLLPLLVLRAPLGKGVPTTSLWPRLLHGPSFQWCRNAHVHFKIVSFLSATSSLTF